MVEYIYLRHGRGHELSHGRRGCIVRAEKRADADRQARLELDMGTLKQVQVLRVLQRRSCVEPLPS